MPIHNLYYLLCYAWDHVEDAEALDLGDTGPFERLEDFFGVVLARGVNRIVRRGLDRSYVPHEEELAGVRGKIEVSSSIKRASLVRHRLVCSFEELSTDILHNRIVASTLDVLWRHGPLDEDVRSEVGLALSRMHGVTVVPLSGRLFSRVQLDRNRRAYRFLLNVCWLLHQARLVDESTGESRFTDVDLERLSMWRVFERFVARFYAREQSHFTVRPQTHLHWWALETFGPSSEGRIPMVFPDLLLESRDRRIILDTKYYKSGGLSDEENAKLHASNLYQLFAYVMNRERSHPDGPAHEGMLLYPTVGDETRVEFRTHGRMFQARSVDLGQPWREIHESMLAVVGAEGGGANWSSVPPKRGPPERPPADANR